MKRTVIALALGAVACAAKPGPIEPTLPPVSAPPPREPPAAPVAVKPAPVVSSDPDVPSGAAAARDEELAAKAAPIVDASLTSDGALTPDGRKLLFVSNREGLPQLYAADAASPAATPVRLSSTAERVSSVVVTRDGKRAIYRSDKGADENWSLFSVGLDGKEPVELTPGETLVRDRPIEPDAARGRIYYSVRARTREGGAVHELALAAGAKPRVVMTAPIPVSLEDVSRDGKSLLVLLTRSFTDSEVQVVDVASGKARKVYPQTGEAAVYDAFFSSDGRRAIVTSDGGGEQAVLLSLDAATGKELARHVEPAGQIDGCKKAPRIDRLACRVALGHRAEVRIFDGALKASAPAKLPLGYGAPAALTDDGTRVIVAWSTATVPQDLYAIDVRTGAAAPLRKDPRPGLAGLPELDVSVSEVAAHDGLKIPVIVSLPAGGGGKKLPVIVEFHGGPTGVSTVAWNERRRFYGALGYAYVQPNVRGSSGYGRAFEMADNGAKRVEALKDIETVARWTASQPWADGDKLVILGGSYGGYSVLIGLTRHPETWRAGVDLFGVASWITTLKTTSATLRQVVTTEIGDVEKDRDLLVSLSPLEDAGKIADPLFVYAGANDPRVPRAESDSIVRALRGRGVPVEYMVAANEGHSLSRRENYIAFLARSARFLEGVLK